jgi:adenine-specific DNA-methyltransferase
VGDIRHPAAKRKNNPPAKIAAEGTVPVVPKAQYAYNPHLPPALRFDQHGKPDALPELLAKARRGPLTEDEARVLAEALRIQEPWLEWTGKREKPGFAVDPVALHIHERISAQAILKVAARQDASKFLFADPEQEYHEAVQFYRHDVDWANRLILGDSLQVMSSLARREDLAGKVQMIYMDPPYGIKFASNFQPEVGKRDVKDKQEDLTREPEMVRAYRDTWHLGIHSYLSYLRDRLLVARELLADMGSIFVQISDENLHRVKTLLDEVFGAPNAVSLISFQKSGGMQSNLLPTTVDYLIWYARDREKVKFRQLYQAREPGDKALDRYDMAETRTGMGRRLTSAEMETGQVAEEAARYQLFPLYSEGASATPYTLAFEGREYAPRYDTHWKTTPAGLTRLAEACRVERMGDVVRYKRYADDFPVVPIYDRWHSTQHGTQRMYVVQTAPLVVERCLLMTTDPGDLVLDPTCGSGTTAYVAEQWGRRWITTDTSRVAIAIARQRLLTAKFDAYKTKGIRLDSKGNAIPDPSSGFNYKTVPHITLKSIAQNVALDPIFARHEPILDEALRKANAALAGVDARLRGALCAKYAVKAAKDGIAAPTDGDARRWLLPTTTREQIGVALDAAFRKADKKPPTPKQIDAAFERVPTRALVGTSSVPKNGNGWEHWQVPFDTDPDWPGGLSEAVTAYRAAWRAKMDEVNACIAASAEQEELVDQPEVVRGVTRVSGPFTVEAVQPPEMTLGDAMDLSRDEGEFGGAPEALDASERFEVRMVDPRNELEVANVGAYLDQMFRYIKADGVRFLNNKQMKWTRLEPLYEGGTANPFHAEGRWAAVGEEGKDGKDGEGADGGRPNVAVVFGPQYGPVTGPVVIEALRQGHICGYEHIVIAGFNFDGAAQTAFDNQAHPKVKVHLAHIRPDINPGMNGLLKESPQPGGGQLFTVFGQPRITVRRSKKEEGMFEVEMEGVDIYNPATDEVVSTGAGKVAAWFLDGDYDGRTFCVTQAFFPDRSAWEKLQKALNGKDGPIDAERFESFSGTTSLPFPKGKHGCVAVKVIDPRGNEVMALERLK